MIIYLNVRYFNSLSLFPFVIPRSRVRRFHRFSYLLPSLSFLQVVYVEKCTHHKRRCSHSLPVAYLGISQAKIFSTLILIIILIESGPSFNHRYSSFLGQDNGNDWWVEKTSDRIRLWSMNHSVVCCCLKF